MLRDRASAWAAAATSAERSIYAASTSETLSRNELKSVSIRVHQWFNRFLTFNPRHSHTGIVSHTGATGV
jgi:hypothetical protein